MIRSAVFVFFCCAMTLSGFAQTQPKKSSKPLVLFSVNKKEVLADEFIYLYKKNHQHANEDFTKEKIDEYLTLYINFKLKVEEARRRGMDTTDAFKKELNALEKYVSSLNLQDKQ